ncbi:TRAP transporter permease [Fredinandcohnia onubensis]|uniref:TRAP transporter permease n=1 Tax=Fredinandcohnia onubensis TaxID=1571209 RepID=UPI000C0BE90D|nr:TRAP transporter permease [Fredinandcohnia onubensis]
MGKKILKRKKKVVLEEGIQQRHFTGIPNLVIMAISVLFSLVFLYTSQFGVMAPLAQGSLLLIFTLLLVFLLFPGFKTDNKWLKIIDSLFAILGAVAFVRVFITHEDLVARGGQPEVADLILGGVAIVLLIEAIRRTIGWTLPILIVVFLIYAFFGPYFPGLLQHAGMTYERVIQVVYLTTEGIFTTPVKAVANFVLVFIILGSVLQRSGTGKVFIDLSMSLFGLFRGGSAKVAVIASSLFGSVSGSAVSNVMGTGTITIPLMKGNGFKGRVAGAIEAVASTGGQIMPPVMGAVAFVMAEMMGVSYLAVVISAIIPSILYYVSLFFMVDLEAAKLGMKGIPKQDLPRFRDVMKKGGHLLIPILVLIILLSVVHFSPQKSAFWTIVVAMIVPQLRKSTRVSLKTLLLGLKDSAVNVLMVSVVCAGAGIIIAVMLYTGLALNLSSLIIQLSGGLLPVLLILTAVASLILGMGLPTTAAYIVLAVLIAPTLSQMGIDPMAAHMFVLYFGVISAITPPVAVAAFAGASLASSNPIQTGVTSFRFGIAGFIVPFMFIYGPELLLLEGSVIDIILTFVFSIIGIYAIVTTLQGFLIRAMNVMERICMFITSILLIVPEIISSALGISLFIIVFAFHHIRTKNKNVESPHVEIS